VANGNEERLNGRIGQMIDDGTFYRLLNYIAWRVFLDMDLGRPLTEIDSELQYDLSKKDCIALFKHMDAHTRVR
jgi:hypothetical protein